LKRLIIFAAMAAVMLTAAIFVSCQKEEQAKPENNGVLQKISDFKADVKGGNNAKSEETISIDEAVWIVEATLNYDYCISLEPEAYENIENVLSDSVVIDFETSSNTVSYSEAIEAYSSFNAAMASYFAKADFNWKKYQIADVEYKNGKLVCRFNLFVKNDNKANPVTYNLNFDWRTGTCDSGRCDGTHPEDNAQTVLNASLNYYKDMLPGYFLTDITEGIVCHPNQSFYGSDTLLYNSLGTVLFPCIYSPQMFELFNNACLLRSRYIPPTGWAISHIEYLIYRNTSTYQGLYWHWSKYTIFIGFKNYSKT